MLALAGQLPCTLPYGRMPFGMPFFFTLLHNSLPVLEDGTSRLELFSSICVGCNMKHMHTFACPVFALDNALASGKSLPRWAQGQVESTWWKTGIWNELF